MRSKLSKYHTICVFKFKISLSPSPLPPRIDSIIYIFFVDLQVKIFFPKMHPMNFNREAKWNIATHSDLSVEIKILRHLKPWSKMWLTLLEILHQLSIEYLPGKFEMRQYLSQCLITQVVNHVFLGYRIFQPNV